MSRSISTNILPDIRCEQVNHYNKGFEFICMGRKCMQFNQSLLCFYCLQQSHNDHVDNIISIREFINQCSQMIQTNNKKTIRQNKNLEKSDKCYQLQNILLNGLPQCSNKQQLTRLLQQIYRAIYLINSQSQPSKRINKLLNEEIRQIKLNNQKSYLNIKRTQEQYMQNHNDLTINKSNTLTTLTEFYQPILSFTHSQNFTILSPFQIKHNKSQSISTCLLHPSLNTFTQSLQIVIKIVRSTPNWIGIGLCIGNECNKYQQFSKNHISLLSNGWINVKGELREEKKMIFKSGDQIKVKWDKLKKLIVFNNLTSKNQSTVRFQPLWNEDVHLFVSMFYKNDTVSIIQSSLQ